MTISADHTAPDTTTVQPAAEYEDALTEAVKKFGITAGDYMLPAPDPDGGRAGPAHRRR